MACAETRPLLDAYFDSELDLPTALNVERHVAECASCAGILRNLNRLRDELTPEVFNRVQEKDLRGMRESQSCPERDSTKQSFRAYICR